jgi:hypothetical protein
MKIILSPLASNRTTAVSVSGLVITIDGQPIDLSVIPEGGYAEPDDDSPFIGHVTRDEVTVRYHYESLNACDNQSTNWADYTFVITDGPVPCPIVWKAVDEIIEKPTEDTEVQDV